LYSGDKELQRSQSWRVRANPNPWDVQFAFDNCPVTNWKTWEESRPGMFVEIDTGTPVTVSAIKADLPVDHLATAARVEAEVDGKWVALGDKPEVTVQRAPPNLPRTIVSDLKRFGITHLSIHNGDFLAKDLFRNREIWGITLLGEAGDSRLYRLD
jgi:hypothetical protein